MTDPANTQSGIQTNIHTSIIVPTYNEHAMLARLIEGLRNTVTHVDYPVELIVVDNNSKDKASIEYLHTLPSQLSDAGFAHVQVLSYPHPFNYSKINNLAAKHASGEFLCFLNNDIEVFDTNWLTALHEPMQHPTAGCVGAMLYYPDFTIQHAGVFLDADKVAGHLYKDQPRGSQGINNFLTSTQSVSAVTAACMLIRQSVFKEVRGFEEDLAVAYNDVDLCLKVLSAGYTNIWTPHAELIHHESKTRGQKHQRSWLQRKRLKSEVRYMQNKWGMTLAQNHHAQNQHKHACQ
jgi:GT2 family glycosyltransferase